MQLPLFFLPQLGHHPYPIKMTGNHGNAHIFVFGFQPLLLGLPHPNICLTYDGDLCKNYSSFLFLNKCFSLLCNLQFLPL